MTVITTRISEDLDSILSSIAKSMQRSKSFIVCKAIERYVIEAQEDIDDLQGALEALKDNGPRYTLEEIEKNMIWKIEFSSKAEKNFDKFDKQSQKLIREYLRYRVLKLDHPKLLGEALRHDLKGLWRYRVDKFRIVCRIQEETLVVLIVQIGHRSDVYK